MTVRRLYFLGGQSNMMGFGLLSELPDALGGAVPGVPIFHGNPAPDGASAGGLGRWAPLTPGFGHGFTADPRANRLGPRFGPELSFARRLRERAPEERFALLKYARIGSGIDPGAARFGHWHPGSAAGQPGGNQFTHFLRTLDGALATWAASGDGAEALRPAGIAWMQGESDAAYSEALAHRYADNLATLMERLRDALGNPSLPIVLGRISDIKLGKPGGHWPHAEIVRAAQAAFAAADPHTQLILATDGYGYADRFHFDTDGTLDLGRRFADAFDLLETPP